MEPSSKLKALKFMQRRPIPSMTKEDAAPGAKAATTAESDEQAKLEANRAKLAASTRWTLESTATPSSSQPALKIVYEQSGGGNRSSHRAFKDFKCQSDDRVGSEEPASPNASAPRKHPRLAEHLDSASGTYTSPTPSSSASKKPSSRQ